MPQIIPSKELKDTTKISELCHASSEPIYITKNGYGDMVVMSMEAFEKMQFESDVYFKLAEAERQAEETGERFSSKDVLGAMKAAARDE